MVANVGVAATASISRLGFSPASLLRSSQNVVDLGSAGAGDAVLPCRVAMTLRRCSTADTKHVLMFRPLLSTCCLTVFALYYTVADNCILSDSDCETAPRFAVHLPYGMPSSIADIDVARCSSQLFSKPT